MIISADKIRIVLAKSKFDGFYMKTMKLVLRMKKMFFIKSRHIVVKVTRKASGNGSWILTTEAVKVCKIFCSKHKL